MRQKIKLLKKVKAHKTGWKHKNLKSGTYYKHYVAAYRLRDGREEIISESLKVHAITNGRRFGNAKKVSVNKKKLTVRTGKTKTLKVTVKTAGVKGQNHVALVRYFSTDKRVHP